MNCGQLSWPHKQELGSNKSPCGAHRLKNVYRLALHRAACQPLTWTLMTATPPADLRLFCPRSPGPLHRLPSLPPGRAVPTGSGSLSPQEPPHRGCLLSASGLPAPHFRPHGALHTAEAFAVLSLPSPPSPQGTSPPHPPSARKAPACSLRHNFIDKIPIPRCFGGVCCMLFIYFPHPEIMWTPPDEPSSIVVSSLSTGQMFGMLQVLNCHFRVSEMCIN